MHDLSVSLWDLRTIPLWSKWTKDLTLYCLNKTKEIMILIRQNSRKPIRQTILLIWWAQFQSYMFQIIIIEYIYKKLDKISTLIPTPTPESFNSNSNSNSGSFNSNSNSNSGKSLEYQLQLQLRKFQLQFQLQLRSWSWSWSWTQLQLQLRSWPQPCCIAAIFVKYCYTTGNGLLWLMS